MASTLFARNQRDLTRVLVSYHTFPQRRASRPKLLAAFAQQTGAGRERHIVLVLDNAGWHGPKNLAVPDGITLVFLPPYSPELQPAERLWPLIDEPVANKHFATLDDLDAVVAERCRCLDSATIRPHTSFHWWPKPIQPN